MNTGYTILETFVGAGGSHLGFMQENFKTVQFLLIIHRASTPQLVYCQ